GLDGSPVGAYDSRVFPLDSGVSVGLSRPIRSKRFTVDLGSFHGSGGLGEIRRVDADNFSTRPEGPRAAGGEDRVARPAALAPEARCVHARLHDDAEEAELGAAQGGAR